jgi:hypothetical protein
MDDYEDYEPNPYDGTDGDGYDDDAECDEFDEPEDWDQDEPEYEADHPTSDDSAYYE